MCIRDRAIYRDSQHVHGTWDDEGPPSDDRALSWRSFDGAQMEEHQWRQYSKNDVAIDSAAPFALLWAMQSELVLLALNPQSTEEQLTLPSDLEWRSVLDTSHVSGQPGQSINVSSDGISTPVPAQSLCVFLASNARGTATDTSV